MGTSRTSGDQSRPRPRHFPPSTQLTDRRMDGRHHFLSCDPGQEEVRTWSLPGSYLVFLSVASVSCSLDTHFSNWSITSVPPSSKNTATDLVNSASRLLRDLPSVKVTLSVYWSSNLRTQTQSRQPRSGQTSLTGGVLISFCNFIGKSGSSTHLHRWSVRSQQHSCACCWVKMR